MTLLVISADDQQLVRAGFRKILEAEDDITVLAEASNGLEAIAATRRHQPDVVLMDTRMPEGNPGIRPAAGPVPQAAHRNRRPHRR